MDKTYGKVDEKLLEGLTPEQRSSILNWEAFNQYEQAMNDIVWQMKEIPVLPSEIPPEDDRFILTRVELPGEGGVLTYMDKMDLPYRGFPYREFVGIIDIFKKLIKGTLSGVYHSSKIKFIPALFSVKDLIYVGIYTFYRLIERYKIKSFRYSKAIQELHRAFSFPTGEKPRMMEMKLMLRDVLCMILEFDNAYRFRTQDIIMELNQKSLRKNPIKELNRLCDLASKREIERQVKDTWKLIKMFNFYLRFDRQLRNMVVDILGNINKEEFKLMPEDIQFCKPRKDYIFGFMTN